MKNRLGCIFTLIILGFGAFGAYRALHPSRVGGTPFAELSPETKMERRADAQKLVKNIEGVVHAARKKKHEAFTLTATEPQLNTLLQDRLRLQKFPINDLRAGITPGVLTIQGTVDYKGFDVPATMDGSLEAKDGELVFHVSDVSLTGVPAPGKIKDKAEKAIGEGLRKAFGSEKNVQIDSVKLETGLMTISGKTG